jgi:molecular chaperone DnaK
MNERIWTEAMLKAEELLPAVDEALAQLGDEVPADDREHILAAAEHVRALLIAERHDASALKKANALLDDATQSLAVLLMDKAMEEALVRKLGV